MKRYRALMDGQVIVQDIKVAERFWDRLLGLARHGPLAETQGLLIKPCCQIHTIGMSYAIDAVFLSSTGEIVHVEMDMYPGLVSRFVFNANQVLELKSGTANSRGLVNGRRVAFDEIN